MVPLYVVTTSQQPKSNWRSCARRIPIAIGLAAAIFFQSSQPGVLGDLGALNLILSSIGHVVMFGALTALLWWALDPVTDRALLIAVAVAVLYGVSDEIHQSYIAARTATVVDVGFDVLGAAIAAFLITRRSGHTAGATAPPARPAQPNSTDQAPNPSRPGYGPAAHAPDPAPPPTSGTRS